MWSPPRARSTMSMRVFEALGCAVFDEPFYAYWLNRLKKTDDPGYAETVAAHETDWQKVISQVLGPIPDGAEFFYQKHMAIHMLEEVSLDWMTEVRNCFLIRHPAEVITSMSDFRDLTLDVEEGAKLAGIPQLERIFDAACEIEPPLVVDVNDLLSDPTRILSAFCAEVGMPFDPSAEIRWAPGKHKYDGAWADAWYDKVYATTCLEPYTPKAVTVPEELRAVVDYCMPTYERIAAHRIR